MRFDRRRFYDNTDNRCPGLFGDEDAVPQWVTRDTIYHIDRKKKEIIECRIRVEKEGTVVLAVPVWENSDLEPFELTVSRIGEDFFWILSNAVRNVLIAKEREDMEKERNV